MPIEDLLALYGYDDDGGAVTYGSSSPNGSEALTQDNAVATAPVAKGDSEHVGTSSVGTDGKQNETVSEKAKSKLRKLFPTRGRIHADDNQLSDSSSEDEDYVPLEDWKKVCLVLSLLFMCSTIKRNKWSAMFYLLCWCSGFSHIVGSLLIVNNTG